MADPDIVRIDCQFCNAALGIPVKDVTDEGKSVICPRCGQSLFINKSRFERSFTYSMHCPKCGEFQDASGECIYCNVLIAKFIKIKGIDSAWETLSKRFFIKGPAAAPAARELTVSCSNCGYSKRLSKDKCPDYITRIGCPDCGQSFDIVNWMQMRNQFS